MSKMWYVTGVMWLHSQVEVLRERGGNLGWFEGNMSLKIKALADICPFYSSFCLLGFCIQSQFAIMPFLVDETPIRVHSNLEHRGIPFPKNQAMGVYSSIWNADDWATQGGRVKTDWSHAPFIASYRGFNINACECLASVADTENTKRCSSSGARRFWWDEPTVSELSLHQNHQLQWVRANHMIYDYCADTARFPVIPAECVHHRH